MLNRWMRQVRQVRPWVVAVALACGSLAGGSCGDGEPSSDADVDSRYEDAPWAEYGPRPCFRDEDCNYPGTGLVCGPHGWCEPRGSTDADADADVRTDDATDDCCYSEYGPAPCYEDEDCTRIYGPGWVCAAGGRCEWNPTADADADAAEDAVDEVADGDDDGPETSSEVVIEDAWDDSGADGGDGPDVTDP